MLRAITAAGRLLRAAVALTVLASFTAGVPVLLASVTGWPLDWIGWPHPGTLPSARDLLTAISTAWSDENLLSLLATFGWLLWALFCRDIVIEVIDAATTAATRRGLRPSAPGRGPLRWTAAVLVGAIVGAIVIDTARDAAHLGGGDAAGTAHAAARRPAIIAAPGQPDSLPAAYALTHCGPSAAVFLPADPISRIPTAEVNNSDPELPEWARDAPGGTHRVVKGDNLWDIADAKLGDPYRWREIYKLNRGHRQANGYALTDPDLIHIGWILALPARNHPAPTPVAPTPEHTEAVPRTLRPAKPTPGSSTPPSPSSTTSTPANPSQTGPTRAEPDPDGVVPEATAPTRSPANTAAPPTGAAAAPPTNQPPIAPNTDDGQGVSMPDGWVSLPLAAALLTAAALVWRRRRHRYQPRPVCGEALDDPDLHPLPSVVSRLRHSVREQAPHLLDPPSTPQQPTVTEYVNADTGGLTLPPIGPSGVDLAGLADQMPASGLGLTGPGAEPAARALLVATLSTGGPTDPDARSKVVIPADALTALLGAHTAEVRTIPRLTVAATLSDALTRVEELLIERRRLLEEYDAPDLADLRTADPYHPPMPPVLLLAEVPRPELHARLSTTLQLGTPLQIAAVLLGEWPEGETLAVHADGRTTATDQQRLAVLDVATTVQLLNLLREAHTGEPATPPQADADSHASDTSTTPSPPTEGTAAEPANSQPATTVAAAAESTAEEQHATEPVTEPSEETDAGDTTQAPQPRPHRRRPVRIRLLGEPAVFDRDGTAITGLRRHARQLLVYLAVHRDGADLPQIMEAFWPTATLRRAGERLSTEAADLRGRIRQAAGDAKVQPVINTGGRYVLNADLLDIDLWRMSDALRRASNATDPEARVAALREAVDAHTGGLADGHDYDWIEPAREQVRRHGVRARLHLANLIAEHDPADATALAQAAAGLDPYNEEAARQAMRSLARIGDAAGIRTRLQRLRDALDEIDEEPSSETISLAAQLQRKTSPP